MERRDAQLMFDRLDRLRVELIDLAFTLDCGGNPSAGDVAMTTAVRLAELRDEYLKLPTPSDQSLL